MEPIWRDREEGENLGEVKRRSQVNLGTFNGKS